ncbi:N-acetyltransferase [Algoriphagus kandeliae]|uniref:N-acetyltransferase n=1 Tax=Algoriphagus kandeliae TaxID=2562278 RepID=A0A4Y9R177_9BACT|nr:acyltransferase [Algoriphagus kandeliae]TFV97233.1 N-acetyltransferase [Algoriphagus kandeliae]
MRISKIKNVKIHPTAEVYTSNVGEDSFIWQFSVILEEAIIGKDCNINAHVFIENKVKLGHRVTIKSGVYIWDGTIIEDDVMVGPNVTFTNDKYPRSKNINYKQLKTLLKKGCSIGAGSIILGGIQIGQYALVAAGSLVSKDVPDYALVLGNPAKIVGWVGEDGIPMIKMDDIWIDSKGNHWKIKEEKLTRL